MTAKVYVLSDPRDGNVFYVGATVSDLKMRLMGHCAKLSFRLGKGVWEKKYRLIRSMIKKGYRPSIELLAEADVRMADHCEKFYYNFFKSQGILLLQSPHRFSHSKNNVVRKMIKKLNKKKDKIS